ncbi:hypothetical protein GQX74_011772 [Glossina fuscipes]|nr:hypothetical protein GQX74_011772 [Glossina fuscipes]
MLRLTPFPNSEMKKTKNWSIQVSLLHFGFLKSIICPLIKIKEKTICRANKLTSEVYWAISIIRDKEYSNLPSTGKAIFGHIKIEEIYNYSICISYHYKKTIVKFTPVVAIATESYCIVPQKSKVILAASNPFLLCRYVCSPTIQRHISREYSAFTVQGGGGDGMVGSGSVETPLITNNFELPDSKFFALMRTYILSFAVRLCEYPSRTALMPI